MPIHVVTISCQATSTFHKVHPDVEHSRCRALSRKSTPQEVSMKGRLLVKVMLPAMLGCYLLISGVPAVA
jgi:hypothetical protein